MSIRTQQLADGKYSPAKCSFNKGGYLVPCSPLDRAADGDGRAGVRIDFAFDFVRKRAEGFPCLRSGEFKKTGIVFNYCPFCGVSLKRLYRR